MADPFQLSAGSPGRIGSLLRGRRAEVFTAIEDLLAQAPRVRDVGPDVVWGVCAARGVDLRRKYAQERRTIYRRYLEHCLEDKRLTEAETSELHHLRSMLHLDPDAVTRIHDEVARKVYGEAVERALGDLELDPDETAFLRRLREELQLPEAEAEKLFAEREWRMRQRALTDATTRDLDFVEHRPAAGEFVGRSTTTVEDAVDDALQKAVKVYPKLHWFQVVTTAGHVQDGRVDRWHVVVSAGVSAEDLSLGS